MKRFLLPLALLGLTGCASLNEAGTASYSVKPYTDAQGNTHCCEVSVQNGKEIRLLDATVEKRGDDYTVKLHEEGVTAFDGQRIAAGAAQSAATSAVKAAALGAGVLIAPIAAPAVGAALMSGTAGAAAVGVGTGVLLNKAAN